MRFRGAIIFDALTPALADSEPSSGSGIAGIGGT